tara:strand:- start:62665 stop:65394 length:2730 start_codon:yes stop_codon:yes gene_type:complete
MLDIQTVHGISEKVEACEQLHRGQDTWVVSDLKSKFEIQKKLLMKDPLLEEMTVLRASELWQKWYQQHRPDVRWVTRDFLVTYMQEYLLGYQQAWARAPGAARSLVEYLNYLLPIINSSNGSELMSEWFKSHSKSYVRWGHWYEMCREVWGKLNGKNWALVEWAPLLLLNDLDNVPVWNRNLTFDLGPQLTPVEAELIQQIAQVQNINVTVFEPYPDWARNHSLTLWPYRLIKQRGFTLDELSATMDFDHLKILKSSLQLRKFSTQLSEVKDAIAQTRIWLESGVDPENISILAPNIEDYWPSLQVHGRAENIPLNKSVVARSHSFVGVSKWLSEIRLRTARINGGSLNSSDLEYHWFSDLSSNGWKYDKFKKLFANILDSSDLQRAEKVFEDFKAGRIQTRVFTRDQFIGAVISFYPGEHDVLPLEAVLQKFFTDVPVTTKMDVGQWLHFLEKLCAKVEIKVKKSTGAGVHCENLTSAEYLSSDYVYIMGAIESNLTGSSGSKLMPNEVMSLSQELGFNLQLPESSASEYDLEWILHHPSKTKILSTAVTRFDGTVEAPSKLWIMLALFSGKEEGEFDVPGETFLDHLQSDFDVSKSDVAYDQGIKPRTHLNVKPEQVRLSVSQLEGYLKCPFIFTARKLFGLNQYPSLDLDIDHMTRGQIMHRIFELLLEEPLKLSRDNNELESLVIRVLKENDMTDESTIRRYLKPYVDLSKRFLSFEAEWRSQFPETETVAREVCLKGFWDMATGTLNPEKGDFPFIGFVDRVDQNSEGHLSVVDYKSSASSTRNHGSWLNNDQLQMALYSKALEAGLAPDLKGEVVSANYFISRTMQRDKGFVVNDVGHGLTPDPNRSLGITSEGKQKLYRDSMETVQSVVEKIKEGQYAPEPQDKLTCYSCDWRNICRAKHLM